MTLDPDGLKIESDRIDSDLAGLAEHVEPEQPGWTRRLFSEAYRESREWVAGCMRDAGLEVHSDGAGNLVGVLAGRGGGPALVTGSHTDTVYGGGRFDGAVGVLAAIEVARALQESDIRLHHELRIVDFLGEEPNDFSVSCVGSRAISGRLADHLSHSNREADTLGAALSSFGVDPHAAVGAGWKPSDVHAFVELHIEQGPRLERQRCPIGIVTGIAGIERLVASFLGRADHAGTMPMSERRDALAAAAQAVLTVERTACADADNAVATTGRIEAEPGSLNIVPEHARVWAEIRSQDAGWLGSAKRRLAAELAAAAQARGVGMELEWLTDQPPVPLSRSMQDLLAQSADRTGLPWRAVPSGAGHDAAHMAALAPTGMVFVPSREGKSHCPDEWTDLEQIVDGVRVLATALVDLDTQLPASDGGGGR